MVKGTWLQERRGYEVWGLGNHHDFLGKSGSAVRAGRSGARVHCRPALLPPGVGWLLVGPIWHHSCMSLTTQQTGPSLFTPRNGRFPSAASEQAPVQRLLLIQLLLVSCLQTPPTEAQARSTRHADSRAGRHLLMGEVGPHSARAHIQGRQSMGGHCYNLPHRY